MFRHNKMSPNEKIGGNRGKSFPHQECFCSSSLMNSDNGFPQHHTRTHTHTHLHARRHTHTLSLLLSHTPLVVCKRSHTPTHAPPLNSLNSFTQFYESITQTFKLEQTFCGKSWTKTVVCYHHHLCYHHHHQPTFKSSFMFFISSQSHDLKRFFGKNMFSIIRNKWWRWIKWLTWVPKAISSSILLAFLS